MELKNKVIIVTGASMGIGKAAAEALSKAGAKVALAARTEAALTALAETLPDSFVIPTDMTKPESIKKMISETARHFGRVDGLLNNAGQGLYGSVMSLDIAQYKKIFELNDIGPLIAMQEAVPRLREVGGGSIVNISSMVSKNYFPMLGGYASTKYALNALSLTARAELEKEAIIVSVVHPGLTATDFGKNSIKTDEGAKMLESRSRAGLPDPDTADHVASRIVYAFESGDAEVFMHPEKM